MARALGNGDTITYPPTARFVNADFLDLNMRLAPYGANISYGGWFKIDLTVAMFFQDFSFGIPNVTVGNWSSDGGYISAAAWGGIVQGQWIHWRVTFDKKLAYAASGYGLYTDGVPATFTPFTWANMNFAAAASNPVVIGTGASFSMANVGIYNRKLTLGEHQALIDGARPHEVAADALCWGDAMDPNRRPQDIVSGSYGVVAGTALSVPHNMDFDNTHLSGIKVRDGHVRRGSLYGPDQGAWAQGYTKVR